jgi:hypothetical protein
MSEPAGVSFYPPAFAAVAARLVQVTPPAAAPGADGAWQAAYAVHAVYREPLSVWVCSPVGGLRLERGPARRGDFDLIASLWLALAAGQQDRVQATVTCRDDAVGSLIRWERRSRLASTAAQGPAPTTMRIDRGVIRSGRIDREPGPSLAARGPVAANWALFDTLRRAKGMLSFTMLEELDALRPDQVMRPCGETTVTMAGGTVRLRGVLQIGRGILPTTWWLHETGLPLMVLAGLRAYTYDPSAVVQEVEG